MSRDTIRLIAKSARPQPPLEAERSDLVVSTDAVEQVHELARLRQPQRPVRAA